MDHARENVTPSVEWIDQNPVTSCTFVLMKCCNVVLGFVLCVQEYGMYVCVSICANIFMFFLSVCLCLCCCVLWECVYIYIYVCVCVCVVTL